MRSKRGENWILQFIQLLHSSTFSHISPFAIPYFPYLRALYLLGGFAPFVCHCTEEAFGRIFGCLLVFKFAVNRKRAVS